MHYAVAAVVGARCRKIGCMVVPMMMPVSPCTRLNGISAMEEITAAARDAEVKEPLVAVTRMIFVSRYPRTMTVSPAIPERTMGSISECLPSVREVTRRKIRAAVKAVRNFTTKVKGAQMT